MIVLVTTYEEHLLLQVERHGCRMRDLRRATKNGYQSDSVDGISLNKVAQSSNTLSALEGSRSIHWQLQIVV
jgi:hypothetical protein